MVSLSAAPVKARLRPAIAGAVVAALGAFAAYALVTLNGTKTGLVLAAGCIAGPVALYAALVAPVAFPFSFYVLFVPFDNILELGTLGTLTKLLAIVSGAFIVLYLLRTGRACRPSPALLVWAALYLWMAATAFWALDQAAVFSLLPTALQLFALYVAIALYPADRNTVRWAFGATLIGGFLAAAYSLYLFSHGAAHGQENRLWIGAGDSAVDPNHFAAALLLPIALAIAIAAHSKRIAVTCGALLTVLVLADALDLSASRGAMLGVAAIVVYLLIRSRARLKLALMTLVPAVLMMGLQSSIWERFSQAFSSDGAGRVDIWKVGMAALHEHWMLGAGYNNFAFAYDQAFLQVYQKEFMSWHRAPHDIVLSAIVELGVPGLLLLLAAWFGQFYSLKDVPAEHPDFSLRLALEATLVGTFVAALFLDVMVMKYLWLTFILIALLRNAHLRRTTLDAPILPPLLRSGYRA